MTTPPTPTNPDVPEATTVPEVPCVDASWYLSLDCECPHCHEDLDLTDDWESMEGVKPCQSLRNFDVTCSKCGEEFTINAVY